MGWIDSPQYLKGIQKIQAMSPEDKAVTQTLVNELHGIYADVDMRKQLAAMNQASRSKQMDRHYDLSKERLGMREDIQDFEKDQLKTAEGLGWGNIALSGLSGYADMYHKKKQSKGLQNIIKSISGT